MLHNTIVLNLLQKFDDTFKEGNHVSMWSAWTLPEIWRDLHPWPRVRHICVCSSQLPANCHRSHVTSLPTRVHQAQHMPVNIMHLQPQLQVAGVVRPAAARCWPSVCDVIWPARRYGGGARRHYSYTRWAGGGGGRSVSRCLRWRPEEARWSCGWP